MARLILLIGIAVIFGSIGGQLFARFKIPQVVGYIVTGIVGILIGGTLFHAISPEDIERLEPISLVALALIGFNIGGELKREIFAKHGKGFFIVLVSEGLFAAALVTLLTGLVTCPWGRLNELTLLEVISQGKWPLAILFGAIASATAPAATVDVLWEYRSRGILTTIVLAIVALDDALSLLLYGFASSVAEFLTGHGQFSFIEAMGRPLFDILASVALGCSVGLIFGLWLHFNKDRERILPVCLGGLFTIVGICHYTGLDLILAAMSTGTVVVNVAPRRSKEVFDQVSKFAPPIFVLFFVLVGARLQLGKMATWMIGVAVAYVLGRTAGKFMGAHYGSKWAGFPEKVSNYLGFCLFSQAGVAIGLAILASHRLPSDMAQAIILVITATTFLVQIIGPPSVKYAIEKAAEAGKDVTREDLLNSFQVRDVMEKRPVVFKKEDSLQRVLQTAAQSDSLYFPVVDEDSHLVGLISFLDIKNLFVMEGLGGLVLAYDLMNEVQGVIGPEATLSEALQLMDDLDVDVLPVVEEGNNGRLLGLLERRMIQRTLSREILRMGSEEAV